MAQDDVRRAFAMVTGNEDVARRTASGDMTDFGSLTLTSEEVEMLSGSATELLGSTSIDDNDDVRGHDWGGIDAEGGEYVPPTPVIFTWDGNLRPAKSPYTRRLVEYAGLKLPGA